MNLPFQIHHKRRAGNPTDVEVPALAFISLKISMQNFIYKFTKQVTIAQR